MGAQGLLTHELTRTHAVRGILRETMKTLLIGAMLLVGVAHAQVYVHPHMTRNGTYVEGYMRTSPNDTILDNYSTRGNVNPYTGQAGTVQPSYSYQTPSYQVPQYRPPQCGMTTSGQYVCQ